MTEENENKDKAKRPGKAPIIVCAAVAIVALVGFLPLEKLSGGKIKDFNLFADLSTVGSDSDYEPEIIDIDATGQSEEISETEIETNFNESNSVASADGSDEPATSLPAEQPSRVGEKVVIEDYTARKSGLRRLRSKIAEGRLARIAFVGDSYIEGDILTQDLRSRLQSRFGGSGVGYMNLHSDFPGFRRSIVQGGKGWKNFTATHRGKDIYMGLSEQYSVSEGSATATYKGTTKVEGADRWSTARILMVAPKGGSISTRSNSSADWITHQLSPSDKVQQVKIDGDASELQIKATDPSIAMLGVWLDADKGVSLDCMSSRGIPGYSLAKLSPELSRQMAEFVDYDLIVLEFGINAMSSKQRNYDNFAKNMTKVVANLRQCYPGAEILILGVGDRGEKRDGAYHSMSTINAMIDAQRKAARESGCLFWDTREAMGGDDAIVQWSKSGKANKDYVHLTHKGGDALAGFLYDAMLTSMGEH